MSDGYPVMEEIRLVTEMSLDQNTIMECGKKQPPVKSQYKTFGYGKYDMLRRCEEITPAILEKCLGPKQNSSSEHTKERNQGSTNPVVNSSIPNASGTLGSSSVWNSGSSASVSNSFHFDGHRSLSSSHDSGGNGRKKPMNREGVAAGVGNMTLEEFQSRESNSWMNTNASGNMSVIVEDNLAENIEVRTNASGGILVAIPDYRAENSWKNANASSDMSVIVKDNLAENSGGRLDDDPTMSLEPSPHSSFENVLPTSFTPFNSGSDPAPNPYTDPDYVYFGNSPAEMRITNYDDHSARIPKKIRFTFEKDGCTKEIPYTHPEIKGEVFGDRQAVRSHELVRIDCFFSNGVTKYVIVIDVPSKSMGKVVVRYKFTGYEFKANGYIEGKSEKFWATLWSRVEEDVDF